MIRVFESNEKGEWVERVPKPTTPSVVTPVTVTVHPVRAITAWEDDICKVLRALEYPGRQEPPRVNERVMGYM